MAERELALTGIGGQGVQFAAQVMSRAAIAEGRQVMMFGSYGGMMRGGKHPGEQRRWDGVGPELGADITTLDNGAIQALFLLRAKLLVVSITAL